MSNVSINSYSAYKNSGIEWLGEIPKHWEMKRVKELGNLVLGKMLDKNHGTGKLLKKYLKSKNIGWLTPNVSNVEEMFFTMNETSLYRVKKGDLLLSEGGEVGKTSYWNDEVNECYIQNSVHKFSTNRHNNSRYLLYLSFAAGHANYYDSIVNFVSIKHLTKEKLARVIWLSPPIKEQIIIATFLDTKTSHIDRQISLLTQKVVLYQKLKQSLINETVTCGLDKTVPMKDSGVEWIGDRPLHWEVYKLSQSFDQIGSGTTPKSGMDLYYEGGTSNWINTGDLNDGILYSCKRKVTEKALQDYSLTIYPIGSMIIAMYGATIGKVSISMISGCTNQACCVLNRSKTLNTTFLFYWFISKREYIVSLSYGGGQPNISQDTIKALRIIAPSLLEQEAIVIYLNEKTSKIESIVTTINTQIEKLKELRKTLINDVVTGKIKVVPEEQVS